MTPRERSLALFGGKLVVGAVLIGWLVLSNSLDFRALGIFFDRPVLLVANLGLYALGVFCGASRWTILLTLAGVRIPLARAIQLQLTGLFFNVVTPGGISGDLIKSAYAAREAEPSRRPTVFVVVFMERLIGLGGLVLIAGAMTIVRGPALWKDPPLRELAGAVGGLAVLTLIGPALLVALVRRSGDRLETWTGGTTRFARLSTMLIASARLVSAAPKKLAAALVLSMTVHAACMTFFTALARIITSQEVSLPAVASVFPFGILTLVVPISPSGIGVGHVAFDRLFFAIGLTGGATVFNVYLIGQMVPCLLGVFAYLALRRDNALPT